MVSNYLNIQSEYERKMLQIFENVFTGKPKHKKYIFLDQHWYSHLMLCVVFKIECGLFAIGSKKLGLN
jgi:hypothetical protein